jgi:hypothetical protein
MQRLNEMIESKNITINRIDAMNVIAVGNALNLMVETVNKKPHCEDETM